MSGIHFLRPDGSREIFSEERIGELREKGMLYSFTYFWKEGMAEWRPVQELTDGFRPYARKGRARFEKDPFRLTAFLKAMLYTFFGASILNGIVLLRWYILCKGMIYSTPKDTVRLALYLKAAIFIVIGIAFLQWIYRANENVRGFGAKGLLFTPRWSIGYYFVPVLNFFRPYQAMAELWKASTDPIKWNQIKSVTAVNIWWAIWILTIVVFTKIEAIINYSIATGIFELLVVMILVRICLEVALGMSVLKMINGIMNRQKAWAEGKTV